MTDASISALSQNGDGLNISARFRLTAAGCNWLLLAAAPASVADAAVAAADVVVVVIVVVADVVVVVVVVAVVTGLRLRLADKG